jgi:orotidine-5'-phosphate decarboxylase
MGEDFCLVTPGIRLAGAKQDDQTRVVTPEKAIADGATYLVIGRPITQAADPYETLSAIKKSLIDL